jgi:sugar phosphate isomerase/epimerase
MTPRVFVAIIAPCLFRLSTDGRYWIIGLFMPTISFPTSNFIGRAMRYRGPHDPKPNEEATLTWSNPDRFLEIVENVVTAGLDAVDIWAAHCHWRHHDREDYLEQIKGLCSQFDLTIASYAGTFDVYTAKDIDAPFRFMKQLGAPLFAGGIGGNLAPAQLALMMNQACHRYGAKWAFENQAEKSLEEILARIDGGQHDRVGIALDTGWCATQSLDPLDAVKRIHEAGKLFTLHLKDIKEKGQHDTCAPGEGIVPCEAIVKFLTNAKWPGSISIEHELYDRDPMPEIETGLQRVKQWLDAR